MPKEELQNHIAWGFIGFADFTDYIDRHQYISNLNYEKYIQQVAVAILATWFQSNEQAVHMVCWTASTWWRKLQPPRNNRMRLWMGMSPDSRFKPTAWQKPRCLSWLLIVKDTELSIKRCLGLVQRCPKGPIRQTVGMVIVEERQQPLIQHAHDRNYHSKLYFGVGTTYIVSIRTIQLAVHFLPLILYPDSMQQYLSNTIDLHAFNLF